MKNIELSQANDCLGQSVRGRAGEPLVGTEAVVPIDDLDLETLALGNNPRFLAILEQARAQCREGSGLSTEEVRRELGLL
ncbi:MAG: hypothetical protein ACYC61_29615 [Isosphaeraceae bacterium]